MTIQELKQPTTELEKAELLDKLKLLDLAENTAETSSNILRRVLFELEQLKKTIYDRKPNSPNAAR